MLLVTIMPDVCSQSVRQTVSLSVMLSHHWHIVQSVTPTVDAVYPSLPSNRRHLSCDDCLEVRGKSSVLSTDI